MIKFVFRFTLKNGEFKEFIAGSFISAICDFNNKVEKVEGNQIIKIEKVRCDNNG